MYNIYNYHLDHHKIDIIVTDLIEIRLESNQNPNDHSIKKRTLSFSHTHTFAGTLDSCNVRFCGPFSFDLSGEKERNFNEIRVYTIERNACTLLRISVLSGAPRFEVKLIGEQHTYNTRIICRSSSIRHIHICIYIFILEILIRKFANSSPIWQRNVLWKWVHSNSISYSKNPKDIQNEQKFVRDVQLNRNHREKNITNWISSDFFYVENACKCRIFHFVDCCNFSCTKIEICWRKRNDLYTHKKKTFNILI